MDNQKVALAFREMLDRYGVYIFRDRKRFEAAIADLLGGDECRDERIVLQHAMDSTAVWILLSIPVITADEAVKAIKQLEKESHLPEKDAEFVVRCTIAAVDVDPDTVLCTNPLVNMQPGAATAGSTKVSTNPSVSTLPGKGAAARPSAAVGSAQPEKEEAAQLSAEAGSVQPEKEAAAQPSAEAGSAPPGKEAAAQPGKGTAGSVQPSTAPTDDNQSGASPDLNARSSPGDPVVCVMEVSCRMASRGSVISPRGKLCLWRDRMEFHPGNPKKSAIQIDYQEITELWTRTLANWLMIAVILEILVLVGFQYRREFTWSEIVAVAAVSIICIICVSWFCGHNLGIGFLSGRGLTVWFYERSVKKQAVSLIRSETGIKSSKKVKNLRAVSILCMAAMMAVFYAAFAYFGRREDNAQYFAAIKAKEVDLSGEHGIGRIDFVPKEDSNGAPARVGNTSGNINNYGYAAEAEGWIYYSDGTGLGWLCRTPIHDSGDGTEAEILLRESCSYVNVLDDWVYFIDSQNQICRIHIDGTGGKSVVTEIDGYVTNLTVTDNGIFVMNYAASKVEILCIREDTVRVVTECYGGLGGMALDGDWIYFADAVDQCLCKIRTDGSELTRVDEEVSLNYPDSLAIQVWNDWVYYITDVIDVRRIRVDGTGKEVLLSSHDLAGGTETMIDELNVHDTGIYVSCRINSDSDSTIWRIKPDTKEIKYLTDGCNLNIAGEKLFYTHSTEAAEKNHSIYRMFYMDLADNEIDIIFPSNTLEDFKTEGVLWQDIMELCGAQWTKLFQEYSLPQEEVTILFNDVQISDAKTGFENHGIPWDKVKDMLDADCPSWRYVFDVYGISETDQMY